MTDSVFFGRTCQQVSNVRPVVAKPLNAARPCAGVLFVIEDPDDRVARDRLAVPQSLEVATNHVANRLNADTESRRGLVVAHTDHPAIFQGITHD